MLSAIDKLLSIASDSIAATAPPRDGTLLRTRIGNELTRLVSRRNGFYAFESALHVFPWGDVATELSFQKWNARGLWKKEYADAAKDLTCFAEDVFGRQFCLRHDRVVFFDPETAVAEELASSIEEWARVLMDDYRWLTGWPFAHEWQAEHGPLPAGKRLVPVTPFILGGAYAVENMHLLDAVTGMRLRASFFRQLRNVPDGSTVEIIVGKPPRAGR